MMKTRSVSQLDRADEQNRSHRLERVALTLLCVGVASSLITAVTALNALAAQPSVTPPTARTGQVPQMVVPVAPLGTLSYMTASVTTVNIGDAVKFAFYGNGYCSLKLDTGDGIVTPFEGKMPIVGSYTYSGMGWSSFDASMVFAATVTPTGNCKKAEKGAFSPPNPFLVQMKVVNPNPQSAGVPAQDNTMVVAGSGKLGIGMKPGTVMPPVVAPTVSSLAFSGGPSADVGNPTVLTVIGTGVCKYHLSYVNLDAQGNTILKPYPMLPKSSSLQSPFPMTMTLLQSTPAGVYKWTASGVDGCTGTKDATLTVQ